ncbi:MAG: cytidylate kinase-like family protein [Bacteroidales bacterium]|nr:cytidylate kinase-like family protein [Bacteroidales bacterium]
MENNIFLNYLNDRSSEDKQKIYPGPVITISRDYGCYASEIAQKLTAKINEEIKGPKWQYITKEILVEAAKELGSREHEIAHIFGAESKTFLGDLAISFGQKKYTSDALIKKTIKKVVRAYSEQGHTVIVGRAGSIIAEDITKSLHIKLIAPKEWRINAIANRYELLKTDATKIVEEHDITRTKFMEFFSDRSPDCDLFQAVFNRASLNTNQIVNAIFYLAKQKTLFLK